jgi:hypothetical protein
MGALNVDKSFSGAQNGVINAKRMLIWTDQGLIPQLMDQVLILVVCMTKIRYTGFLPNCKNQAD